MGKKKYENLASLESIPQFLNHPIVPSAHVQAKASGWLIALIVLFTNVYRTGTADLPVEEVSKPAKKSSSALEMRASSISC